MLNVQYQWDIITCINEVILLYSLFMVPSQTNSLLSPNVNVSQIDDRPKSMPPVYHTKWFTGEITLSDN